MTTLGQIVALLKKYLKPYVLQVVILAFLLVVYNGIQITNAQIVRFYINNVLQTTDDKLVLIYASLIYIGINLIRQMIYVFIQYSSQNLAWESTNDLRLDLTRHCLNLDMSFHNKNKTGEMIERIDGDATTLSEFFSTFIIYFIGSILFLAGVLIAVFIESWLFGLVFIGFTVIALISFYFLRKITSPLWKKVRESTTALFGNIEESISGLEDIRANGANDFLMMKFHDYSKTNYRDKNKANIVQRVYWGVNIMIRALVNLSILVASFYISKETTISPGTIYLLLTYGSQILFPLRLILWQLEMMQNSLANIERIYEWFGIESKIKDEGKNPFPIANVAMEFQNVHFGYSDEKLILKNISFTLSPGKRIGLIGHTGSGKTTIARLIFRMYEAQFGSININGCNVKEYPLQDLRKNIAYVTQDVELFKASIKDNITFFNNEISDQQVLNVIQDVGLSGWYKQLTDGLETEVYTEEGGLSAGEEQLLALSRAFLKDPKIVILDEASSRLDPATERRVDTAFDRLLHGRSAIIIAHRLATLHKVDDIILLDQGEIIEYGPREELIKDSNSKFSQLLEKGIMEVLQ